LVRVYGNTAINTGYYTVTSSKDGSITTVPARYSFTCGSPFIGSAGAA
jgi:hypothetical protein